MPINIARELSLTRGMFEYIEGKIRRDAEGTTFGGDFEWLCKWFLENAPRYRGQLDKVWLWKDWPDRWGTDAGIDIVARTRTGELWAIQAKADHPDRAITKREIDSFLSESNRSQFAYRLLMATTDDIGATARRTLHGQEKPVGLVLRGHLLTEEVEWPDQIGGTAPPPDRWTARPHQATAIKAVVKGFRDHDRGRLIMACGTGKTLTALWIAERLQSSLTLVLVPSLSLVQQNLAEWGRHSAEDFDTLVVCSDESVVQSKADTAIQSTADLGVKVTTDPAEIRKFLSQRRKRPAVVFATYQSSDRIASAFWEGEAVDREGEAANWEGEAPAEPRRGRITNQTGSAGASPSRQPKPFDLVICDEAHRLAGNAEGLFGTVLDDKKIRARKRLFMTATPRYFKEHVRRRAAELESEFFQLVSMDDVHVFGPEFHVLTFHEAISANPPLLTDYQVVVIGVTDREAKEWAEEARLVQTPDGLSTDTRTLAAQIGLAKAMKKYDLRKLITFHSSVAKAARFVDPMLPDSLPGVIPHLTRSARPTGKLWTKHISGHTPAGQRATLLKGLGNLPDDTRGILSNCACLGEGVDVPVLDGVAFIDPKRSMVDIIQAVGRVIRKAAGKQIGTIVIPVFIDETEDADHVLSQSAFEPVWQVLKALRAHDRRLADELDQLRLSLEKRSKSGGRISLPENIHLDVPRLLLRDFEQAFYVRTVEQTTDKPRLTIEQILAWADAHYAATGDWPDQQSGQVTGTDETWSAINNAMHRGLRGLPSCLSLAKLMAELRGVRNKSGLPRLSIDQILGWADAHHAATGDWPNQQSGQVTGTDEKWSAINHAMHRGLRGLPGRSSLAQLLAEHRSVRNNLGLARLNVNQILGWADAHHAATGDWPSKQSGQVTGTNETWARISAAIRLGLRGLPSGLSLAQLLAEQRSARNHMALPPLSVNQILGWADAHHAATGDWPDRRESGNVTGTDETWPRIISALNQGQRNLPKGSSLAKLLATHRGVRNSGDVPSLTVEQILTWLDSHRSVNGEWPNQHSGHVLDTEETWAGIQSALSRGSRGLPGGTSIAKLLAEHRGIRNIMDLPPMIIKQILVWADEHHKRTGDWPRKDSGEVMDTDETWAGINSALSRGNRGCPGDSTLAKLLAEHRGVRNIMDLPALTTAQILAWVDEHKKRTDQWPDKESGTVIGTDETWAGINAALSRGNRGLPGGTTLGKLLGEDRKVRNHMDLPPFTIMQILAWVDGHKKRTSVWPKKNHGKIADTDETWGKVSDALHEGLRGLPGGSSLAKLLAEYRSVRNIHELPPLTTTQILAWAEAYKAQTGAWPNQKSGTVKDTDETWLGIDHSLRRGNRNLPGGSSLTKLLAEHRGVHGK